MIENSWSSWTLEADPNIIIYHRHEGRGANLHSETVDYNPGSNFMNISSINQRRRPHIHAGGTCPLCQLPFLRKWSQKMTSWLVTCGREVGAVWPLWVSWMTVLVKDRIFLSPTCTWRLSDPSAQLLLDLIWEIKNYLAFNPTTTQHMGKNQLWICGYRNSTCVGVSTPLDSACGP